MSVALLIAYRNRENHLKTLINWASGLGYFESPDFEFILVEQSNSPSCQNMCLEYGIKYHHVCDNGIFHKSRLLNIGLNLSNAEFIAPFDIDLVPIKDSLKMHLAIASKYKDSLFMGYRMMYPEDYIDRDSIFDIDLSICKVAPEDKETAVFKQLVDQEKFGVVPFFRKETLLSVKAWDEAYIGWGAEDQDLIERYTKTATFYDPQN